MSNNVGLSPSIVTSERDFLVGRRRVSFGFAGTVGNFNWGEVNKKKLIQDEKTLVQTFHEPDDDNFADWYAVSNYHAYNDKLYVVRAINETDSYNAGIAITETGTDAAFAALRKNKDDEITVTFESAQKLKFLAKYAGSYGNKISVAMSTSADFATANIIDTESQTITFKDTFEYAPAAGELAIVVMVDDEIVERHVVSLTQGSKDFRGRSNYIENYIERMSRYIYVYDNTANTNIASFEAVSLAGGAHTAPTAADYNTAFNEFDNPDEMELDVLYIGGAIMLADSQLVIQHVIDNILPAKRRDAMFIFDISPDILNGLTKNDMLDEVITFSSTTINRNTSFAAYYPDCKYQYDRYNDKWRWMPISGDIAGVYSVGAFFEAPAGLNRGMILNCARLMLNPDQTMRDVMYPLNINPIYTLKNIGHAVMGQKTLLHSASIFSRVETRRLFSMMQKAATNVAKYYQFQKNTPTERRRFVSDVEPFYRQLVGLDGLEDYLIVCDETNNTSDVRESNEMIADFYLKPTYSAEWIRLNFNATRGTVNFEDIVAQPLI